MSRIKSKNTAIETSFCKALWHEGIRYRKNYNKLPGKPDIAIVKYKIAVFCDGEFWHGKDWDSRKEKLHANREYWIPKIERNMDRDKETDIKLSRLGWIVLRFWGRDIQKNLSACVQKVRDTISAIMPGNNNGGYDRCGQAGPDFLIAADNTAEYQTDEKN
jgi:DNA mismatch endonuclease (patch repair protein)